MRKFYKFCLLFLLCLELSAQSPGGISTNIKFWLAADDVTPGNLVNGTGWTGRAGLPNFSSVSSNPQAISNAINFNQIIEFDGSNDGMGGNGDLVANNSSLVTGNTVGEVFVVLKQAQSNNFTNGAFTFASQGGVETAYTSNGTIIERFGILQGDGSFNFNPTNGSVSSGLANYPTGSKTDNSGVNPKDWNIYNIHAAQNNWQVSFNNLVYAALNANNVSFTAQGGNVFIGKGIFFNRPWAGEMAEIINYERILTSPEKLRVNSYLAIKYGITLGDKNTPTDYKSSDNTTVWTADAVYQNGIFGIGRDNTSFLHQRISKSIQEDSQLFVSTDTNFTSENTSHTAIATNNSFLLFGHNNFEMGDFAPYNNSNIANQRSARIWKVVSSGTSLGNVNIRYKDNTVTHMLVSTDPTFASGVTEVPLASQVASYNFGSGTTLYISFGKLVNAPGGVYSSSSNMNGVSFKVYDVYDSTLENGFDRSSTLLQKGVSSDLYNLDKHLTNESRSNYTISAKSTLTIPSTSDYYFQFQTMLTNTHMAIYIDGGLVFNGNGGPLNPTRTIGTPVNLTAGTHDLEVIYSKGAGSNSNMLLRWSTDNATYTPIPDQVLSINAGSAEILNWYRSDMGIANADATTLTSWQDQSGFDSDLVIISGTPTYYNATATQLYNFNPSVVFEYDNAVTSGYSKNVLLNENPRTSFSVTSKTNSTYQYIAGIGGGNSLGSNYFYGFGSDFYRQNIKHFNQNSLSGNPDYQYNNAYLSTVEILNPKITPTNNLEGFVNNDSNLSNSISSTATSLSDVGYFSIGDIPTGGSTGFIGNIMEVFHYPFILNNLELNRVHSYLGLKYGVSLSEGIGANYTASNGSTIFWDPVTNNGFNFGIFGIGRDDVSMLEQQISTSSRNKSILTLSTDNNFVLPNKSHTTIPNNLSFFMVGNNGLGIDYDNYLLNPAIDKIMKRKWKVQETGVNIANINININDPNVTHLLVSSLENFSTLDAIIPLTTKSATYDFNDGEFFTFGFDSSGAAIPNICPDPGNLACETDVVIWLKDEPYDATKIFDQMFLQIESFTKGLALTQVVNPEIDIEFPYPGMLVFDETEDCLKIYRNASWSGCIFLDKN